MKVITVKKLFKKNNKNKKASKAKNTNKRNPKYFILKNPRMNLNRQKG
jgi:hypothetical protein